MSGKTALAGRQPARSLEADEDVCSRAVVITLQEVTDNVDGGEAADRIFGTHARRRQPAGGDAGRDAKPLAGGRSQGLHAFNSWDD